MDYSLSGAFIVGLMGAGHCIGMCGGLIGALSTQIPIQKGKNRLAELLKYQITYSLGRISSYVLAGIFCGAIANALGHIFQTNAYLVGLRFLAGIMMIITGLYISQIWLGLTKIESLGRHIWSYLQPFARKLLPIQNLKTAFSAGFIWGWLPCGLVYSMLTWSVASASFYQGGLIMFAFGLGTLPALIFTGLATNNLNLILQNRAIKMCSGLLLIGFGIHTFYIALYQLN